MTTGAVAASPVQDGAHDVLAADTSFFTTLLGGRFYTDVPQGTAFPLAWLTFDDPMHTPQGTFGRFGAIVHLALHVYSEYEGDDQCLDILTRGVALLHHGTITATGYTVPFISADQPHTITVEDYNGKALRHGIARIDVHCFA